jgi:hypothetical protein
MTCRCGCGRPVEDEGAYRAKGGRRRDLGYSAACFRRWRSAGYPASGPPAPVPQAARPKRDRAGRIEDFRDLLSWGETATSAARRLGVGMRTIERYSAELAREIAA